MGEKKLWRVYVPVIHSEIYEDVEAETEDEAIEIVQGGGANCIGESVTGKEEEGFRAEEQES